MKYQLYKHKRDGKFYFKLKAKNGWPLLSSQPHESKEAARETIDFVRRLSGDDDQYERKIAKNGRHFYQINNDDDKAEAIATSRFYASERSMNSAIKRVKTIAPKAIIVEKQPKFLKKKKSPFSRQDA